MTKRERAALLVLRAQQRTRSNSFVARKLVGRSPNLTFGALCRKGLAEWVYGPTKNVLDGWYQITPQGIAALESEGK